VSLDTDDFEAVVYDLDGTLVRLDVDWDEVAREAAARFASAGVDASEADLWAMLDLADEHGLRDEVEAVLAAHERAGAERSARLAHADCLTDAAVPVGVCSLNAETACRVALDVHGLAAFVDAVVGRDSVSTRKPDPEPLLAVVRRLGTAPERTLFVGDSERDAVTAERAGTAFQYVDGGPSGH
jgi:phosphoglycolate phosphatase